MYIYYVQYITEVSTPLTFLSIFYYIFSCDNTEEMTLCYNVKYWVYSLWAQLAIFSPRCRDSLVLQGLRCEWGEGVKFGVIALTLSHTGHWKFNMAPHGKELSEELKKELLLYIKMAKAIRRLLRPWNWAAARWPRPYSGLTGQAPLRTCLAMVDQRSWEHVFSVISRGCVWEIDVWVLPALLQRLKGWGGSAC